VVDEIKMSDSYVLNTNAIQLEISTKCNALCPGCVRTDSRTFRNVNPLIPTGKEMPLEMFEDLLKSEWSQERLNLIEFCGTMDEPLMHSRILDFLDLIFKHRPRAAVQLHTNGGARNNDFYVELANKMKRFGARSWVKFSIDGVGETNEVYRYGVKFERVLSHLKTFTSNGGRAILQTLVFPWNKHQIEQLKAIALESNCYQFWLRPDRSIVSSLGREHIEKIRAESSEKINGPRIGDEEFEKLVSQNINEPVSCAYRDQRRMIFISWDGNVWPCCFWTHARYENLTKKAKFEEHVLSRFEPEFNSLKRHSFDKIINHALFQQELVRSWRSGDSLKRRCVEKCSVMRKRTSDGKSDDKSHIDHVIFKEERL
jgi:MoaA/NifB/PqqE/SkfB family radical SAM enzyme